MQCPKEFTGSKPRKKIRQCIVLEMSYYSNILLKLIYYFIYKDDESRFVL